MFQNEELLNHLKTTPTIQTNAAVIAELNMNIPGNIAKVGNYRYRPYSTLPDDAQYAVVNDTYTPSDPIHNGATDSSVAIDGGLDDNDVPIAFISKKEKEKLLYSLDDCFGRFRPRSGINKLRYFSGKYTHHENIDMSDRPRYYMADKDDVFKYWTSYRLENGIERGISKSSGNIYYIDDCAPFIVYKDNIPANRIVVKMQTNIGSKELGPFSNSFTSFPDPLYGDNNATVPQKWKVQYLNGNTWKDAISFDETSTRDNGLPIVGADGYVQLSYGLIVPDEFKNSFRIAGEYTSNDVLPINASYGEAYLVKTSETDPGVYFIWNGSDYESYLAVYGWYLDDENVNSATQFITKITDAPSYVSEIDGAKEYREFKYIRGLRIVVDSMNTEDTPFDLIELSPRISIDISDSTENFTINKTASDLGVSGMPVGQLIAATGNISIFDADNGFSLENQITPDNPSGSIISKYINKAIQFKFYEKILNVPEENSDAVFNSYYVPIKTMYADEFPSVDRSERTVSVSLRDLYMLFESITAPQILVQNVSVSYAVSLLLDSIGFTNYSFKRVPGETELIIPNFFIPPNKTVAEVLQDLAIATQTSMFFDEYNDFIMFSRNYMMPNSTDRQTDLTLVGTKGYHTDGNVKNLGTDNILENIISVSDTDSKVFNDGTISYTNRYIQRSYSSLKQANLIDRDKSWIYKPALLWEVAGTETTKSINDDAGAQSTYMLSAIPLNSNLSDAIPEVVGYQVINNTMDFGEGIYWISRYNGYFYANGEVIRYDAVQYSVSGIGNVWIQTNEEYQKYFSGIPFNGKMYPTGLVRIFTEPQYETVNGIVRLRNGVVARHGRGQFGTTITSHSAGINTHWSNSDPETAPVRGIDMRSEYLFSIDTEIDFDGAHSPSFAGITVFPYTVELDGMDATRFTSSVDHEFTPGDRVWLAEDPGQLHTLIYDGPNTTSLLVEGYISTALLSNNTFTIAQTREDALDGIAGNTGATTAHDYAISLIPETNTIAATIEFGEKTRVVTASAHNLLRDQRVFFQTSGSLPGGMVKHQAYYVVENNIDYPLTETSFYISLSWRGAPLATTNSGTGQHSFTTGLSKEAALATIIVPDATKVEVGNIVQMVSGPGRIPSTSRITSIHYATEQIKNIQSINVVIGGPGEINCFYHGLESGDKVSFDSTGILPTQILKGSSYYVIKVSESLFQVSSTRNGSPISFSGPVTGIAWFIKDISDTDRIIIDPPADIELTRNYVDANNVPVQNIVRVTDKIDPAPGKAGWSDSNNELARKTTRNSIMKNFLAKSAFEELDTNRMYTTQTGTVQSSAMIMNGPSFSVKDNPIDFVSYAYKPLDTFNNKFVHFGTRLRIIGRVNSSENTQTPIGSISYYQNIEPEADESVNIAGASGGLGILVNPETNNGYFLEIVALTDTNLNRYSSSGKIHNIIFYKTVRSSESGTENSSKAIPVKLWGGLTQILTDDGNFSGQFRMATEEMPTVYDIAVEYIDIDGVRKFYIYLNNQIIAVVEDAEPLEVHNNIALFTRGSSRLMFENVYALANNYSQNTTSSISTPIAQIFSNKEVRVDESFRKYAMSGIVQETFLSNIDPLQPPKYNIYYEEFGTIMREASYFNIKYDKAYPALYAQISPTINSMKGYTVSGFRAGSYGAEFLVFNNTDSALSLDETTGNYLRIQGVTFTQQSQHEFKVDEYFSSLSDFSKIDYDDDDTISSIIRIKQEKDSIRDSRALHGKNDFSLVSEYIQDRDSASNLMGWMISKIMKQRKSVGVEVFGMPLLQLGDIVNIDYKDSNGVDQISTSDTRFVVYSIEYSNGADGPSMTAYLSEVE